MTEDEFYPSHFNDLAQKLEDNINILTNGCNCQYQECVYRTIIGRAYYAAYIHAREWVKDNYSICRIRRKHAHSDVRVCLKKNNMKLLSDILYELHEKRKDADYEPSLTIDESKAKDVIKLADRVITVLK